VILSVEPSFAMPGGEIVLHGRALLAGLNQPTQVFFSQSVGTVVFASPTKLTVIVPESATGDSITVATPHGSASVAFTLATLLSENLHPVANPAVDEAGNIYVTFSGSRGQSVPTSTAVSLRRRTTASPVVLKNPGELRQPEADKPGCRASRRVCP